MSLKYVYAHTPSKDAPQRWHLLEDHIIETAKTASEFAKAFGSGNAGFALGIFHDLGKVNPSFQAYLKACNEGKKLQSVPHAICGASYLWKMLLRQNSPDAHMAMSSLGHHGGLNSEHLVATEGGKLDQWWRDVHNKQLKERMQEALKSLPLRTPESLPVDHLRRELRFGCSSQPSSMLTTSTQKSTSSRGDLLNARKLDSSGSPLAYLPGRSITHDVESTR